MQLDETPRKASAVKQRPASALKKSAAKKMVPDIDSETPPSSDHVLKSPIAGHTRSALKSKSKQGLTPLKTAKAVGKVDFPDLEVEVKSSKKREVIVEELEEQVEEKQEEPPSKAMKSDEVSDSNKEDPQRCQPQIDVSVQRLRHLGYLPKPILAIEATPTHSDACDYVAVARENGHVELKSPDEKWRTLAVVPGMPSRTVDVMTWVCGNCDEGRSATTSTTTFSSTFHQTHSMIHAKRRLIGASRDGTIFLVDFQHGRHTAVTGSGGGAVFALVTLCDRKTCADGTCAHLVAAGCEDGSVRLFKLNNRLSNETTLDLAATIPCSGAAVLSLAWRRSEAGSHGMGGTVLYAGVADGTIRRFDCASALARARKSGSSTDFGAQHHSWKSTLRMTVESYGRRTPTRVWALVALADGTVVSGDSLGHVQFWDGMTGTMLQTFDQNDNKADVLALAVSENESTVYASGVDSRVISIERPAVLPNSKFLDGPLKWILTHARRPHTHDVKALAICRLRDRKASLVPDKDQHEILCSGGIDTKICTYLVCEFKRIRPKSWYPWPTVSPISVAKEARIICMLREDTIDLHRLGPQQHPKGCRVLLPEHETLLGSMEIKSPHNLVCADVSPDGELLAVSDGASLMMFELQYFEEGSSAGFVPQKIELNAELRSPCLTLKFASNETLICATSDGPIRVLKIASNESEKEDSEDCDKVDVSETHVFDERMTDNANPIQSICVRGDGRWFSVARGGVGNGCVDIFTLPLDDEGSYSYWWSLPALEAPISTVKFLESEQTEIVAACSNFSFYIFDINAKRLSEWSEKEGFPLTPKLPYELTHQNDAALRCATNPATPRKFLLVS